MILVILLNLLIVNTSNSFAESKIVFTGEVQLYNDLYFCQGHKEKSILLEEQVMLYQNQITLTEEAWQNCKTTLDNITKVQEETSNNFTSFFSKLKSNLLSLLVGVALGALLI